MAFHNVRLPEDVERGAQGGPGFNTAVVSLATGYEQRNMNWQFARCKYDISYGIQTKQDFSDVLEFFYARRGRAHSFRFKDWSDFELIRQNIGTGDGADATWQIFKRYTDSGGTYDRDLTKIVSGTVSVWVASTLKTETTHYTVNYSTGVITFTGGNIPTGGQAIEVECEFDVPCRFDSDDFGITLETFQAGAIPSITIVEVRGES